MTNEEIEAFDKMINKSAMDLAEHFDTVVIVCTHLDENKTSRIFKRGVGNYYGQLGSVQEWLVMKDQDTRNDQSSRNSNEDP